MVNYGNIYSQESNKYVTISLLGKRESQKNTVVHVPCSVITKEQTVFFQGAAMS